MAKLSPLSDLVAMTVYVYPKHRHFLYRRSRNGSHSMSQALREILTGCIRQEEEEIKLTHPQLVLEPNRIRSVK